MGKGRAGQCQGGGGAEAGGRQAEGVHSLGWRAKRFLFHFNLSGKDVHRDEGSAQAILSGAVSQLNGGHWIPKHQTQTKSQVVFPKTFSLKLVIPQQLSLSFLLSLSLLKYQWPVGSAQNEYKCGITLKRLRLHGKRGFWILIISYTSIQILSMFNGLSL